MDRLAGPTDHSHPLSPIPRRVVKILVFGAVPQQPNLGVSALAEGSAAVLRRAFPEADVRFRSTGPEGDGPMNLSHTSPLVKEMATNRRGLREWTRSFDLICDIRGGDSFTDIYSLKRLVKLSVFPLYAQALRRPIVMLPQTIGPFEHRRARLLARQYLKGCRLVMARDPQSAQCARDLGRPVDLTATDVVFAIERPSVVERDLDVLVNVSGLLWSENPHVDAEAYRSSVRRIVDALLAQGRRVALLAHVVGEDDAPGDNDRHAVAALEAEYGSRVSTIYPGSLEDVRRTIARSRVLIGARMHACLNALSLGVPAVPMAYSRKFAPLLEDLGWHHTVEVSGPGEHVAAAVIEQLPLAESDDVAALRREADRRVESAVHALRHALMSRR
ncbi:polysaccharide pyruvyl transferase family protein [Micrococcus luteus]